MNCLFYGSEMQFLCDVFQKCRVQIKFVSPNDTLNKVLDKNLLSILENVKITKKTLLELIGNLSPNTLYKNTSSFKICYLYFLLPNMPQDTIVFIGPILHKPLPSAEFLKICEKLAIPPKDLKVLNEYYSSIPLIEENSHLFTMLDTFCEKIWGNNNYTFNDIEQERILPISPINQGTDTELEETLASVSLMEQRYEFENQLIDAVKCGQTHKVDLLLSGLNELSFEKRTPDLLRNLKNYCIIMNTLFRKAAENGGVIPIYLDKVSSAFAVQIEQITNINDIKTLMKDIFRSYCRLVRKHKLRNYSPIVQKTIILIESDLSANLTLNSLAKIHNVSDGYLSTIFKKETGKNLIEYIREKRMQHAEYLLSSTHLQIQTIALYCGIMDVQYFSKIFKKHTGKTPKEYRESMKSTPL